MTTLPAALSQKFKYYNEIETVRIAGGVCPPSFALSVNKTAYRWVSNPSTSSCFHPPAIKNPRRVFSGIPEKSCGLWGLSMHESEQASLTAFKFLEKSFKNLRKTVGNHIASVKITPNSGVCSPTDQHYHFDVYEYEGNFFENSSTIIKAIPCL